MDPYGVLGIKKTATKATIKKAFRRRSMETHPDRGGDANTFNEVHLAYKVLMDDVKREKYDQTGTIDSDVPDNSMGKILEILSGAFSAALGNSIESSLDIIESIDVVKVMKELIDTRIDQLEEAIPKLKRGIQRLNKLRTSRIKCKDDNNFLAALIENKILPLQQQLQHITEELEYSKKAITMLKSYSCDVDIDVSTFRVGKGSWIKVTYT